GCHRRNARSTCWHSSCDAGQTRDQDEAPPSPARESSMIVTLLIIAVTCVVSFAAFRDQRLMGKLILWPPAIRRGGEYYRLLSYGLVHADAMHLLFNMVTLYFF